MGRYLKINEVKRIFSEKGCTLVSTEYINTKQRLDFICMCGCPGRKSLEKFKLRSFCSKCGLSQRDDKRRIGIKGARKIFEDSGFTLLEEEYVNSKTYMECICVCGNKTSKRLEDIRAGQQCKDCGFERTRKSLIGLTLEDVVRLFKDRNCKFLSGHFEGKSKVYDYVCSCGRKSKIRVDSFLRGARCRECYLESNRGVNSPNWKHAKTDEERLKERKFSEYSDWRKSVFERDSYICDYCEVKGGSLAAHHLDGWHWCIEKRLDIDNGVTLCTKCHKEFHDKYSNFNNTKEQYEEWVSVKRKQGA